MVASTTAGVGMVAACYHASLGAAQPLDGFVTARRSDPADEIPLDALTGQRDERMQLVTAERLLHLAQQ
jgi:hypothetical protein